MPSPFEQVATRKQAAKVAGIRPDRVDYWVRTDVVIPMVSQRLSPRKQVVLFDLRELMSLVVASQLRERGISLQHIRAVVQRLRARGFEFPLAQFTFATEGKEIYFQDEHGEWESGKRPHHALITENIDLGRLRADIQASQRRLEEAMGRTERRRGALGSKEVFAGTRVPVGTVVRYLRAGKSEADVLAAFPTLTPEDIAMARRVA
jgi:uncharacterized protein (DUF433 family)